jgi:uncharacterized protein
MRKLARFLVLGLLVALATSATAADVPYLTGRVTDEAEILSPATRQTLTERLKAHEDRTGDQIAVLTVPSLGGESIEEYAVKVFAAWKLGQKGKDNGVLIVVAPAERRMRIEVGYGLEGTLTDLLAGRIIRNVMTPRFKAGDYNGGVEAGVDAVLALLEKGVAPAGESSGSPSSARFSGLEAPDMPVTTRILIGAFIFGIIGLFTAVGILTPGAGWFLYFFLIPFWAMFPVMVVGTSGALALLVIYVIGFPLAKLSIRNKDWYRKAGEDLRKKGRASIGGFTFTASGLGGGWSSGGGSGFSGGGFSGGGGSSGGGGASGGW